MVAAKHAFFQGKAHRLELGEGLKGVLPRQNLR